MRIITKEQQDLLLQHYGSHQEAAIDGLGITPQYYRLLRNYPEKHEPSKTLMKLVDFITRSIELI